MTLDRPDYLLDAEEKAALACGCISGAVTGGEHHESWCPSVTGDFMGLPVIELDEMPEGEVRIVALDRLADIDQDASNHRSP